MSVSKDGEKPTSRSYYLDNLRSSLTGLVIYHHTAIAYGGTGNGIYQSVFHPPSSSAVLIGFNAVNQSFFMGTFFFLSGHFSRKNLERKPRKAVIRDRLYRLGLPTAAYTLLGTPCCHAIIQLMSGRRPQLSIWTDYWTSLRGIKGPIWFTGVLLLFDLIYLYSALSSKPNSDVPQSETKRKDSVALPGRGSALAACAAASFAVRLFSPSGKVFTPLSLRLAYLPQYIAAYLYGTYVDDPLDALPSTALAGTLLATSIASSALIAQADFSDPAVLRELAGGPNLLAFAYALWNETTGYLLGAAVLAGFQRFANRPWGSIGRYAYPAFLVHIPVSVFFETWSDKWNASGPVKTAVVGTLNVMGSWIAGRILSFAFSSVKRLL